jgi:hypothetical protein
VFDGAVVSAMAASSRVKPRLTPLPEEISILVREKNYLRRRWQRTRDPLFKSAFNRAAGKLRRDLQAFRRRSCELAAAQTDPGGSPQAGAKAEACSCCGKGRKGDCEGANLPAQTQKLAPAKAQAGKKKQAKAAQPLSNDEELNKLLSGLTI